MITEEQAYAMRALIEQLSVSLTDAEAIEAPHMFPMWRINISYSIGDRVQYQDILYTCIQAHTSQSDWVPALTPALWKVTALENEIPEWVQPLGSHDAYNKGDRVIHNDIIWESTIDANVYEPGVYGWDEVE